MRPNKKLFFEVLKRVTIFCESEGFVTHPLYISAWEPANQAYQASLLRSDVSEYIDQLNVSFYPAWNSFRFDVKRSKNAFKIRSLNDFPDDAGDWTDCWLYQPFDEYLLSSGSAWNVFSIRTSFGVSKRKSLSLQAKATKVCEAFERNSVFLFDALRGEYRGRLVDVSHYEIVRPK